MRSHGHLFVVHGRIESLVHDAAIVSVGEELRFASYWQPLVGPAPQAPRGWPERGFGGLGNTPARVWAINVGCRGRAEPYPVILERLEKALRRVDERRDRRPRARGKGTLPLVAVPVVGIGRGGYDYDRGAVLRELIGMLHRLTVELDLDVALVTPEPAVYAAAQYARRHIEDPVLQPVDARAKQLGRQARKGDLALLLGAGVSVAAGLPGWDALVEELAEGLDLPTEDERSRLSPIDRAELIQQRSDAEFVPRIVSIVQRAQRPSTLHALLAGLDCRQVVTTNYDLLYEDAVGATGRKIAGVMPWASAQGAERWVLKLHGDIRHRDKIVLTRRHMVRYDAVNRPSGAMLQSLLLTKRLLVVGTSMTDDNVLRLAHEVLAYRKENGVSGSFGVVLDAGNDAARAELWHESLEWLPLGQLMGCEGPRAVELFLDRVAMHASRDSSWLLDERFEGLLADARDRALADQARALAHALTSSGDEGKWERLIRTLRDLGVRFEGERT